MSSFFLTLFICTFLPAQIIVCAGGVVLASVIPAAVLRLKCRAFILSCQAAIFIAIVLFTASNHYVNQWNEKMIDQDVFVSGRVVESGTNAAGTLQRYQLRVTEANGEELPFFIRYYVYLYTDSGQIRNPGDVFEGKLSFFDTAVDYGYGKEDRIFLSAYLDTADGSFSDEQDPDAATVLYQLRSAIQERISYGREETNRLLRAVCFGDTNDLDTGLLVSLRRTGLSHVTSVSGLHLTVAVMFFNLLFIFLGISYRVRYVMDIFISIFFTLAVGFPLSCIRACVMLIFYYLGLALNLISDGCTSLSIAAFLVALFNPFSVRDVGFLLSISATFGILVLRAPVENFLFPKKLGKNHRINWIYRQFTGIFACSAAASLATLPVALWSFGSFSLIAPVANLILIFPLQWIFISGILMVLLGWIPGVGAALGWICDGLYAFVDHVGDLLGRLSFSSVSGFSTAGILALLLLIFILAVGIYDYHRHQRRSFLVLLTLLLCFSACFRGAEFLLDQETETKIAFIDVGFGDCTVISRDHEAVIIDYGGSSEKRYNLVEYLQKENVHTIQLLAFTHLHQDHTNGLRSLLRNCYVDQILYPELGFDSPEIKTLIQSQNAGVITEGAVETVLGDVQVEIIADAVLDTSLEEENERCVCYRINIGETSVLITGDLEGAAELKLSDLDLDCTLLKVAHHGSDSSSFYPFIKAAAPEVAVISVGENSYGLPDESVIERLRTVCSQVLLTAEEGTIIYATDGTTMERVMK